MRIETRYRILIGVSLITVIATILAPPIPQDPLYHRFADQNNWLSVPNSFNVLSNLFFAWVGCVGLYRLSYTRSLHIDAGIFSLKHIAASVGCLVFLRHLYLRRYIQS
jgi:hypothetical protein